MISESAGMFPQRWTRVKAALYKHHSAFLTNTFCISMFSGKTLVCCACVSSCLCAVSNSFICVCVSAAFKLSCAPPQPPLHGDVWVSSLHSGGQAFFSCQTGFRLQGSVVLTCCNASTPYWIGKEPHCEGETAGRQRTWNTSLLDNLSQKSVLSVCCAAYWITTVSEAESCRRTHLVR